MPWDLRNLISLGLSDMKFCYNHCLHILVSEHCHQNCISWLFCPYCGGEIDVEYFYIDMSGLLIS